MKRVSVQELEPGLFLAENIRCEKTDRILLAKNLYISIRIIDILKNRGVEHVFVSENMETEKHPPVIDKTKEIKYETSEFIEKIPGSIIDSQSKKIYKELHAPVNAFIRKKKRDDYKELLISIRKMSSNVISSNLSFIMNYLPETDDLAHIVTQRIVLNLLMQESVKINTMSLMKTSILSDIGLEDITEKENLKHIFDSVKISKIMEPSIDNSVLKSIEQHHECVNGKGWPKGIKDVSPHAQLVGISNLFFSLDFKHKHNIDHYKDKYNINLVVPFLDSVGAKDLTIDGKKAKVLDMKTPDNPLVAIESENDFGGYRFINYKSL